MARKTLYFTTALVLAAFPACLASATPAPAPKDHSKLQTSPPSTSETGGQTYGDRDRGGPYGFYSYPTRRHVDGGSGGGLDRSFSGLSEGTSPYDNSHGSAYYGRDYGAPYFGGGYYDRGTYYRERRDR